MASVKKISKKLFLLLMIMILVIVPIGVSAEEPAPDGGTPSGDPIDPPKPDPEPPLPEIKITKIELTSNEKIEITEGEEYQLKVKITYSDGSTSEEIKTDEIIFEAKNGDNMISVSNTGKITAKGQGNGATVKAKSKDGEVTSNECTVDVKERKKSSDASIISLEVTDGKLSEEFKSTKTEYTYIIPTTSKITENNFKIKTASGAKVISTNITTSKVTITVQAEDGAHKQYILNIKKEKINLNLKSLSITGYALKESFNTDTLVYSVTIPYEATDVTVVAATEDPNAKLSIKGATNLDVGENVINIVVSDGADDSNTYKIIVTREKEVERKETGNSSKYSNPKSYTSKQNIDVSSPKHTLRYVFVTLGSIILFAIGGFGIYFYIITSKKQLKKAKIKSLKQERLEIQKNKVDEVSGYNLNHNTPIEPIDITKEFEQNNDKDE